MPTSNSAEITRADLAQTLLQMSKLNIRDVMSFPFMQKPSERYFVRAIKDLVAIGAMDADRLTITPHGEKIMKLALEPCLANALLRSAEHGCTEEMLIIVALISIDYAKVFYRPPEKCLREVAKLKWRELWSDAGDHLTLLNVYRKWTVDGGCGWKWCEDNCVYFQTLKNTKKLVDQIGGQLTLLGVPRTSCRSDYRRVQAALAASFSDKAASHYADGVYFWLADKCQSIEQRMRVTASADSALYTSHRKLVICHKVITSISKKTRQMLLVTEVDKDMLPESVRAKVPEEEPWTPGDRLKRAWLTSQNPPTSQSSARRVFLLANNNLW